MNEAFIVGFINELEKRAFFDKKELNAAQGQLKKLHQHLAKSTQTGTPASTQEFMVDRPGSAVTAATSMCGDIGQKIKRLKPLNGKKET